MKHCIGGIYILVERETLLPFWVGQSHNPGQRLRAHFRNFRSDKHETWYPPRLARVFRGLRLRGRIIDGIVIERVEDRDKLTSREWYWIRRGLLLGWPLVNTVGVGNDLEILTRRFVGVSRNFQAGRITLGKLGDEECPGDGLNRTGRPTC